MSLGLYLPLDFLKITFIHFISVCLTQLNVGLKHRYISFFEVKTI